ncbi:hypothetical protein A5764_04745 [Mycobacterium sp. 852002-51057_SCH5723018]|nr:hypothetical protein A5764_04745 [Mycobacterium sp. 852002-51057_SCH5723018]
MLTGIGVDTFSFDPGAVTSTASAAVSPAIAHSQPVTTFVELVGALLHIRGDCSLQGCDQQLLSAIADYLIEQRRLASPAAAVGWFRVANYHEQGRTSQPARNAGLDRIHDAAMIIFGKARPLSRHLIGAHPQVSSLALLEGPCMTSPDIASFLWSLRADGREVPVRRTNYRQVSNTLSPSTTEDTSQSVSYASTSSDAAFQIKNGVLTSLPTTSGNAYRYFDAGAPVTRVGGRFVFNNAGGKTTYGGAVCIAISNQSIALQNTSLRFGLHLYVSPQTWGLTKCTWASGSPVFTDLATGAFDSTLTSDGVTEYEVEIYHPAGRTSGYVVLPDGNRVAVTDSDIASWAGNWAWHECGVVATTDIISGWTETWSDTQVQVIPSPSNAEYLVSARGEIAWANIYTSPSIASAAGSGANVSGLSISVPFSNLPIMVEAQVGLCYSASGDEPITIQIVNSSGGIFAETNVFTVNGPLNYGPAVPISFRIPPKTAAETYNVRAFAASGTGQINVLGTSAYLRAVAG